MVNALNDWNFVYEQTKKGKIIITGYVGAIRRGTLIIPAFICNHPVRMVAFKKKSSISEFSLIQIEEGVENIADGCFRGCRKLKQVDLPRTIGFIGEKAFASCPIEKLTLPHKARIRKSTFDGTPVLQQVKRLFMAKAKPKQANSDGMCEIRVDKGHSFIIAKRFNSEENLCPLCYCGKLHCTNWERGYQVVCQQCGAKFSASENENQSLTLKWSNDGLTVSFQYPISEEMISSMRDALNKRYKCIVIGCDGKMHLMLGKRKPHLPIFRCDTCGTDATAFFDDNQLFFSIIGKRKIKSVSLFDHGDENAVIRSASVSADRSKGSTSHVRYNYRKPRVGRGWQ